MRYDGAELREQLAAQYVLGTMPRLARRRFERLIVEDPALARLVADWTARLAPFDEATPAQPPPARVWRTIERRIAPGAPRQRRNWLNSLALWRWVAAGAAAAMAALILYIAVVDRSPAPVVVAVLSDDSGAPSWIAFVGPTRDRVSISAIRELGADPAHSFELWGIAGGSPPRPLGLLQAAADHPTAVQSALLPPIGGTLAVSLEPPAGSPTGAPTGPVLYKGSVLARPL